MVDTMNPNAVRIDVMVTPCSRNSVRRRSASDVSSLSTHSTVSRMRENCERRASRFAAAASKRDARSSRSRSSCSCMHRFFSGSFTASSPRVLLLLKRYPCRVGRALLCCRPMRHGCAVTPCRAVITHATEERLRRGYWLHHLSLIHI